MAATVQALSLDRLAYERRRNRAMAAWTDLQTLRSVAASLADGVDQVSIARVLGISQPAVSKLACRARATVGLAERSPREVILERAIGMIADGDMLRQLCGWTYALGHFEDGDTVEPESYMRGLRDQLEEAAGEGLLGRDEFDQIICSSAS